MTLIRLLLIRLYKEAVVTYNCGCGEGIHLVINNEYRDTFALMSYFNVNFYRDQYGAFMCFWKKLKKILVYNLEVEEDNSYVVQNIIVHNCQDISVAGKQAGIVKDKTRSGLLYEVERLLEKSKKQLLCQNIYCWKMLKI